MQLAEQCLGQSQPAQLGVRAAAGLAGQFGRVTELLGSNAHAVNPLGLVERAGAADRVSQCLGTARGARVERPTPVPVCLRSRRAARDSPWRRCPGRTVGVLRDGLVQPFQEVPQIAAEPSLPGGAVERVGAGVADAVLYARERATAVHPLGSGLGQQGEDHVEFANPAKRAGGAAQCPLQPIGRSRLETEERHQLAQATGCDPGLVDAADVALLDLPHQPGKGIALRP